MTISIGTGVALAGMALWVVKLSRARQGGGPEAFATS
jgi:hypothetical protein